MGKLQAMHKYFVVFLALVAWHDSLLTHGRKMKPLSTDTTLPSLKTNVKVPGTPSSEKKVDSPVITKYEVDSFGDSGSGTNAFRPTTPGGSPGVGHRKFAGEDEDMKAKVVVQSPDVRVSVSEGSTNNFSSTTPGHSPGVGHAYQNSNGLN